MLFGITGIFTKFPVFIIHQFFPTMDPREPIPLLLKRARFSIPVVKSLPFIGLKWAGALIGVLSGLTYAGLLIWSLMPPTRLAILPGLNLIWSILLILGAVTKKPVLLLPALGSSIIAILVLALFVAIDAIIFIIIVTIEWKFSTSEFLQKHVDAHFGDLEWKWALYDFYLMLCLEVLLIGVWIIVYSLFKSLTAASTTNDMELDVKYKSVTVESYSALLK